MTKTNIGLCEFCQKALDNRAGYVYGTFGQICTKALLDDRAKAYPAGNLAGGKMRTAGEKWIGKRVMDCVGLIKYYLWADCYNQNPIYNTIEDKSADSMNKLCTERGAIESMPEIKGLLLFMKGHVGVYMGGGFVIESMGTLYGVKKTKLINRGWTSWGKCPFIKYIEEKKQEESEVFEMKKAINVSIDGILTYTDGYFADGKNLFTADFIRSLGFNVNYDKKTKIVYIKRNDSSPHNAVVNGKNENLESIFRNGFNYVSLQSLKNAGIIDLDYKNGTVYINSKI